MLRTESHIHDCTLSPEVKACWHYSVSISRQLQYSLENMTLFKGSSGVLVRSYRLCEKHQCSRDRLPYSLRTSSPGLVLEPTAHAERTRGKEVVVTERCTFHVRKEARHSIRRDGVGIYRCDQWKKKGEIHGFIREMNVCFAKTVLHPLSCLLSCDNIHVFESSTPIWIALSFSSRFILL